MSGENPREIALRALNRRGGGTYLEDLLEAELARGGLSAADRRLCLELVYGVARWEKALDWLVRRKTGNRTQKPALQNLLRLGLYQVFWLDRVPSHAAVHETVELAKHSGFGPQAGFLNAVLRGYVREADATRQLLADLRRDQPHVGFSHPEWLVDRWRQRWGLDQTLDLLRLNNTPPKTFARVNTVKISAEKLLPLWREENVEYDFVRKDWLDENLVFELKSYPPLGRLGSFQQGLFYVQDPSTLLAVRLLDPQPGENILDLCAAPGGKLTHIAQLMRNEGRLVAHDITPDRLRLVEENCSRLGITIVETALGTGRAGLVPAKTPGSSAGLPSIYDRILIDAPCSNTGVMRRRVDLRWRLKPEELERLRGTQLDLLRTSARVLKPGGLLVYSTCSLEPEENREVLNQFLGENPAWRLETERELIPFRDGVDGAYAAVLVSA